MQSTFLLLTILVSASAEYTAVEVEMLFQAYKEKYRHDFGVEDSYRKAVFESNLRFAEMMNKKGLSYELGITPFSHLTNSEFKATMTGKLLGTAQSASRNYTATSRTTYQYDGAFEDLPRSVDYVKQGRVTKVKNQGECGSCWAFSTVGALEGLYKEVTGKLVDLSEQQLMDCSKEYGNEGCGGGNMDRAYEYVEDHGIKLNATYPYKAHDQLCANVGTQEAFLPFNVRFGRVKGSYSSVLGAIAHMGPLSVAVEADSKTFQLYKKGVIKGNCGVVLNHGVVAVGYDLDAHDPYYLVKNSWGTDWGEHGYVKIGIDHSQFGICGILKDVTFPVSASYQ